MGKRTKKNIYSLYGLALFILIVFLSDRLAPPSDQEVNSSLEELVGVAKVHFIDVGQGDAILIQAGDLAMLIDAGENNQGNTVIKYLEDLDIHHLDYVIGTHPHSDHIGGLDDVINSISISKIIMPNAVHTTRTFEDVIEAIDTKNLRITKAVVGDTYKLGSGSFTIVAPSSDKYDNLNNYSVGIRFTYGDTSFLMAGDAEILSEKEMLDHGLVLSADVLKMNHHGSAFSSYDPFLDAVQPKYAVFTVGAENDYGHPHKEVLKKLKDREIPIFRTDQQQTIVFSTDGTSIQVNTDPYSK